MPQHSTWDDDDRENTDENTVHNGTDWDDFDRSIRSDTDTWCERVGENHD